MHDLGVRCPCFPCFGNMRLEGQPVTTGTRDGRFYQPPRLFRQRTRFFMDLLSQCLVGLIYLREFLLELFQGIMDVFHCLFSCGLRQVLNPIIIPGPLLSTAAGLSLLQAPYGADLGFRPLYPGTKLTMVLFVVD